MRDKKHTLTKSREAAAEKADFTGPEVAVMDMEGVAEANVEDLAESDTAALWRSSCCRARRWMAAEM